MIKRAALLLALAAAAARPTLAQSCSPELFVTAARYAVAINPYTIAVGQFDGDGIPDLAAAGASFGTSGLVVLPGNGDGTFGTPIPTDVSDIAHMAAADFNGDGFTDIALDVAEHHIMVFISNGDGTFQPGVEVGAVQFPSGMQAAALTPGGPVDLVLPGDSGAIYVIPGNGDGTFGAPIESSATSGDIVVGDLNGDGNLDVVGTDNGAILVSLGHGDRTFDPPMSFPVAPSLGSIAIGDVDGDGHADVGVAIDDYAEVTGGFVGILKGNGDGTLQAAVETPVGQSPRSLSFADLDGDGALDAVVEADGFVIVLRGTNTLVFASLTAYIADDGGVWAIAVEDLDGDGVRDVATANRGLSTLGVLLGQGDGSLKAATGLGVHTEYGAFDFAVGDLDGDALGDLIVVGGGVRIFHGRGRGTFAAPELILEQDDNPQGAATGDFDGDGRLDLAVSVSSFDLGSGVAMLLQRPDGSLSPPIVYSGQGLAAGPLVPADYDGNGTLDVASLNGLGSGSVNLAFLPGDGHGALGAPSFTSVSGFPQKMVAGDFDGDGKADLATIEGTFQTSNGVMRILLSNGDGTFSDHADYDLASLPYDVATGSVSGSGALDIIVADGAGGSLLFTGNGDGTFQAPVTLAVDDFPLGAAIADFDGDGQNDVVITNTPAYQIGQANLLVGIPGGFAPPVPFSLSGLPRVGQPFALEGTAPGMVFLAPAAPTALFTFLANSRLTALALGGSAVVGQPAVLHASASGYGPVTYQWRKGGVPLSDGGTISGVHTATLTIDPVSFSDAGSYDVLVTDSCASTSSNSAALSVEFADVPASSPFHDDILSIATEGITGGCGGGNYCPTSPVRRDQMAVFLLKSEHGSAYVPPGCTGAFADVACPGPFTDWVEQLAAEGVTGGCGGGNYCPSQSVTRAQMAIFLLKTSQGSSYTPPTAVGIFGDVPVGSFGADFIEDLYNKAITGGCQLSPLLYCPGNAVLRQQMATFLVRTFSP
jgi:hypothetical protein